MVVSLDGSAGGRMAEGGRRAVICECKCMQARMSLLSHPLAPTKNCPYRSLNTRSVHMCDVCRDVNPLKSVRKFSLTEFRGTSRHPCDRLLNSSSGTWRQLHFVAPKIKPGATTLSSTKDMYRYAHRYPYQGAGMEHDHGRGSLVMSW
jgi:hypothetical protein